MLLNRFRTLLSLIFCSIAFLCRVSRRLALFRGSPECVRQHLRPAPFPVCRSGQASASVRRPARCLPLAIRLHVFCAHRGLYSFDYLFASRFKYIFACLCLPVLASLRVLCVVRAVSLCNPRSCVIGSLSFSSLSCSSVQDPRGPASFLHALA